jgi:uncharacterized protein (TIGR00299 family) protein
MIAYFDCFSGISGDMTLGAFIDLGVPPDWLEKTLKEALGLDFALSVEPRRRMGISGRGVKVDAASQPVRHYSDIRAMIKGSPLPAYVQSAGLEMFDRLAAAEAKIHDCPKDDVHFHEVGAVDSIVDIVGAALCADYLGIRRIAASRIPLGRGTVTCAHGVLPVPAPATLEILRDVPVYGTDIESELVTPTGAAIIRTLAGEYGPAPEMRITAAGYGAGSRELGSLPNLLRVVIGEESSAAEQVLIVETGIDDMNPEVYGYLMERLFEDGALDVCMIPAFMKKNRPGTLLQVLCPVSCREAVVARILTETTTLGVRYYDVSRRILERKPVTVETPYGPVTAKQVRMPDGRTRVVPEYEVCRALAAAHNIALKDVYELVARRSDS